MKANRRKIISAFLWIVLLFVLAQKIPVWWKSYRFQGENFPSFQSVTLEGEKMSFPIKGKAHAYIFWASWCGPCEIQLELINEMILSGDISKNSIYAINLGEKLSQVKKYVDQKKLEMPVFLPLEKIRSKNANEFQILATPTIVFVDQNSKIDTYTTGITPLFSWRLSHFLR